ncbi:unnamed protein product [Paramecium sonneborni]|uniref:Actin-related protein n=1 Tax=Paramecium sonneborni TaxID=65129 RepID=A0A8S1QUZ3_9CILI|nr:unnamed protein product [Paramecium sonneborni]
MSLDKQSRQYEVILEIGCAYTKVGFSLDTQPKKVIKLNFEKPLQKSRLSYELSVEEKLYQIFNVDMVCNLKGRSVALIYNYYNNEDMYNIIAYVLFYKFEVAKIAFLIGNVLPLYLTGHFSGFVIDLGYNCSTVSAVYDGYSLLHQTGYIGEGGRESAKRIQQLVPDYSWEQLEDIAIKYAKVLNPGDIDDKQKIKLRHAEISEFELAKCYTETYFGNYKEEESNIAFGFLKIVSQMKDRDIITKMAQNIVITGGARRIPNLLMRFKNELLSLLETEFSSIRNIKFYITNLITQHSTWVGGALIVQIGGYDKFIVTNSKFRENGNLFCTRSDAYNFISIKP